MPNLIDLRQVAGAGETAAKQGLGFGRSGNPTLRGTIRRMSRQVKHRVGEHTGSQGKVYARKGMDKARKASGIGSEIESNARKLKQYQSSLGDSVKAVRRSSGGSSAESAYKASGGLSSRSKLPYANPASANESEVRTALRSSTSGEDAARGLLGAEEARFRGAAATAYKRQQQGERLNRHANAYKSLLNRGNNRVQQTNAAVTKYGPAAYLGTVSGASLGAAQYHDSKARKSDGETNLSKLQRRTLKNGQEMSRWVGGSKNKKEILSDHYQTAMRMPQERRTIETGLGALGGGAALLATKRPIVGLGGVLAGTLVGSSINKRRSEGLAEQARERIKDDSYTQLRDRVRRLAEKQKS